MKKQFFILLFLIFPGLLTQAQEEEYEYTPFPDSNAIWSEYYTPPLSSDESPSYHALALFNEDTVINSIKYHKLFRLYDTVLNREHAEYVGAIREDSAKRVYYKGEPFKYLMPTDNTNDTGEVILYDFSLCEGDTLHIGYDDGIIVKQIDTILINGNKRRKLSFKDRFWVKWIEGIGSIRGLLFTSGALPTNGVHNDLICFKHQEKKEYFNNEFTSCFPEEIGTSMITIGLDNATVKMYPNPVRNQITFKGIGDFDYLQLLNLDGETIETKNIVNQDQLILQVNKYITGIYFYRLISNSGIIKTGKFIIQ